jgi:hypothetical protein
MKSFKDQLIELAGKGYEDISIPKQRLVEFFEELSCEFPILVNNKKVWIHPINCDDTDERIMVETEIANGDEVFLEE